MSRLRSRLLLLTIALGALSCSSDRSASDATNTQSFLFQGQRYSLPYSPVRVMIDSARALVSFDDVQFVVIASADTHFAARYKRSLFDRLQVFALDTAARTATPIFTEVVSLGRSFTIEDLTADGFDEIVVHHASTGAEGFLGNGMSVYGWTTPTQLEPIFLQQNGALSTQDLDGDGAREILVTDAYYGVLPHGEAIYYTADIYRYDGKYFASRPESFARYYATKIEEAGARYLAWKKRRPRPTDDASTTPYRELTEWLVWLVAGNRIQEAERVWLRERTFVADFVSDDQFEDLQEILRELVIDEELQSEQGRSV